MKPGDYVIYTPTNERGTVSSTNGVYAFVKFEEQVEKHGWDNATAQPCSPEYLNVLYSER